MSNVHSTSLFISTIDINLASESRKRVESIKLSTNNEGSLKDIETSLRAGDTHQKKLMPLLVVTPDDHVSLLARCSSRFKRRYDVIVDIDLQDVEWMHEEKGIKTYRKTIRHVELVLTSRPPVSPPPGLVPQQSDPVSPPPGTVSQTPDPVSPPPGPAPPQSNSIQAPGKLVPVTDELIRTCAKFRVLIIGNSGVGKSTLIRRMFGVNDVHASETVRGDAVIDNEFVSGTNERFVVHDSLGFEAGDEQNIGVVKEFVKRRQAMPRLEEQLHAIWLCVEIPYSGGRLAERGVEQLLKNQRDIIGNVPLIVVLTKVDLLDIQLDLSEPAKEPLESRRSKHLDRYCITPLQKAAGRDVPCLAVSAKGGYYMLISNLMAATQENMAKYSIDKAPRAMASIAQRVDIKEKIRMSIDVGKKKYWNSLLASAFFRGHTLQECLEVIRKDIVTVWNFIDLDHDLLDEKLIKGLIPDSISPSILSMWKTKLDEPQFIQKAATNVGSFMSALLRLPYDSYKEAVLDVEILMAYIVDLICVMQVIFLLAPDGPVTRGVIERAIEYCKDKREQVHNDIKAFDKERAVRPGQDLVSQEMERLIWHYKLSDEEMARLRHEVGASSNA